MWLLLLAACTRDPVDTDTDTDTDTDSGADTDSGDPLPTYVLSVSSYFGDVIHLFDPDTGEPIGEVTGLDGPQTVEVGPDGDWIACSELQNAIVRIDPVSYAVTGTVVADDPETLDDETGGLLGPDAATFGSDGHLYVSSFETDAVLRYTAAGVFVDVFVAPKAGGLNGPDLGLGFDPDGALVVPGWYSDRVHRYDPATGEPLTDLVPDGAGLGAPREVRFDRSGVAYVTGFDSDGVLRVDVSGTITELVPLNGAAGMAIDEDRGVMYVSSGADDQVHAYDLATGYYLGELMAHEAIDGATAVELLRVP